MINHFYFLSQLCLPPIFLALLPASFPFKSFHLIYIFICTHTRARARDDHNIHITDDLYSEEIWNGAIVFRPNAMAWIRTWVKAFFLSFHLSHSLPSSIYMCSSYEIYANCVYMCVSVYVIWHTEWQYRIDLHFEMKLRLVCANQHWI